MCVKCGLLLEAATIPQWISQFWKSLLPPIGSRPAVGVRLSPEEDTEQDAVLPPGPLGCSCSACVS